MGAPDVAVFGAPMQPLDPAVESLLKTLQDRRETLKDFTAKIDYSVYHPVTDDTGGKRGTLDFQIDAAKGPIFTVDFTDDTDADGKAKRTHHQQVIFDGKNVTTKDFEPKEFMRMDVLPPGAKPGDAVTLNGPLTLPIGIRVDEVARNFEVTLLPPEAGAGPDEATLRLMPRVAGKFDFKQLDITVDKKLELPTKLVQTAKNKDVTTIKLTDIQINAGKAHMQGEDVPASEGWKERK